MPYNIAVTINYLYESIFWYIYSYIPTALPNINYKNSWKPSNRNGEISTVRKGLQFLINLLCIILYLW